MEHSRAEAARSSESWCWFATRNPRCATRLSVVVCNLQTCKFGQDLSSSFTEWLYTEQEVEKMPGAGGEHREWIRVWSDTPKMHWTEMDNHQYPAWKHLLIGSWTRMKYTGRLRDGFRKRSTAVTRFQISLDLKDFRALMRRFVFTSGPYLLPCSELLQHYLLYIFFFLLVSQVCRSRIFLNQVVHFKDTPTCSNLSGIYWSFYISIYMSSLFLIYASKRADRGINTLWLVVLLMFIFKWQFEY